MTVDCMWCWWTVIRTHAFKQLCIEQCRSYHSYTSCFCVRNWLVAWFFNCYILVWLFFPGLGRSSCVFFFFSLLIKGFYGSVVWVVSMLSSVLSCLLFPISRVESNAALTLISFPVWTSWWADHWKILMIWFSVFRNGYARLCFSSLITYGVIVCFLCCLLFVVGRVLFFFGCGSDCMFNQQCVEQPLSDNFVGAALGRVSSCWINAFLCLLISLQVWVGAVMRALLLTFSRNMWVNEWFDWLFVHFFNHWICQAFQE